MSLPLGGTAYWPIVSSMEAMHALQPTVQHPVDQDHWWPQSNVLAADTPLIMATRTADK